MIFETRDDWEISDPGYMQLVGGTGVHRYPLIKVSLNLNLFHMDVRKCVQEEEVEIWERYILVFIQDIIDFIATNDYEKIKISIQTASSFSRDDEYCTSTITEIIEHDEDGQKTYTYKCQNGETYFDSFNTIREKASSEAKIIYANYH